MATLTSPDTTELTMVATLVATISTLTAANAELATTNAKLVADIMTLHSTSNADQGPMHPGSAALIPLLGASKTSWHA